MEAVELLIEYGYDWNGKVIGCLPSNLAELIPGYSNFNDAETGNFGVVILLHRLGADLNGSAGSLSSNFAALNDDRVPTE